MILSYRECLKHPEGILKNIQNKLKTFLTFKTFWIVFKMFNTLSEF